MLLEKVFFLDDVHLACVSRFIRRPINEKFKVTTTESVLIQGQKRYLFVFGANSTLGFLIFPLKLLSPLIPQMFADQCSKDCIRRRSPIHFNAQAVSPVLQFLHQFEDINHNWFNTSPLSRGLLKLDIFLEDSWEREVELLQFSIDLYLYRQRLVLALLASSRQSLRSPRKRFQNVVSDKIS